MNQLTKLEFDAWLEKLIYTAQTNMVEKHAELKKSVKRAQSLREYMLKMIEAPLSHVEAGLMPAETLVYILLCASMFVQRRKVGAVPIDTNGD